jgi:hypothetical protein
MTLFLSIVICDGMGCVRLNNRYANAIGYLVSIRPRPRVRIYFFDFFVFCKHCMMCSVGYRWWEVCYSYSSYSHPCWFYFHHWQFSIIMPEVHLTVCILKYGLHPLGVGEFYIGVASDHQLESCLRRFRVVSSFHISTHVFETPWYVDFANQTYTPKYSDVHSFYVLCWSLGYPAIHSTTQQLPLSAGSHNATAVFRTTTPLYDSKQIGNRSRDHPTSSAVP